ncbi:hypothetical protein B0T25DRAFT_532528 [Lasiosphaeria hispida]|uniref:Rho-GAP domain-containing protein n=1 Tax=Lasiosphaeria hispida TaxID=260671 RepID=A0AAJ0HPY8_9PEZI|nr:hypothetical protein B0T25DRAFT_532528 [Lasiosphaeria hispida]
MLAPDDYSPSSRDHSPQHRRGWFSRTFRRQVSGASNTSSVRSDKKLRIKRSVSDLAMHIVHPTKRATLKDEDLQSLVRLCGKSMLYLPSEYAPCSLVLPTCFRATAQYLVQHAADTRGVFRIPGSVRVVNALYDYYCAEGDADEIASTTRCPNLPLHIKAGTHDVASTFKRLLSGLPGGILGSLSLFDALVAIHSQLKGDPEFTRTKQTKLRARLIALAVSSVRSQFRRELICAVFGLLCLIGRTAEKAPREDENGRPLPTADLMGYNALGIVFGPLLVGDLINSYTMKLANPSAGLVLFPVTPPHTKRERRRSKASDEIETRSLTVDKIHVANAITEMLVTHWRDVVKHMKSLGVLKTGIDGPSMAGEQPSGKGSLRPSASESFVIRKPAEWSCMRAPSGPYDMSESPVPPSPTPEARRASGRGGAWQENSRASLAVQRQRPKVPRSSSNSRAGAKASLQLLSPTAEEPLLADFESPPGTGLSTQQMYGVPPSVIHYAAPMQEPHPRGNAPSLVLAEPAPVSSATASYAPSNSKQNNPIEPDLDPTSNISGPILVQPPLPKRRLLVSKDSIMFTDDITATQIRRGNSSRRSTEQSSRSPTKHSPADLRTLSSKIAGKRHSRESTESIASGSKDGRFKTTVSRLRKSEDSSRASFEQDTAGASRNPAPTSNLVEIDTKTLRQCEPKSGGSGPRRSRLPTYKPKHGREDSTNLRSPARRTPSPIKQNAEDHARGNTKTEALRPESSGSETVRQEGITRKNRGSRASNEASKAPSAEMSASAPQIPDRAAGHNRHGEPDTPSRKHHSENENGGKTDEDGNWGRAASTPKHSPTNTTESTPAPLTPGSPSPSRSRPAKSAGSAVKAMAAKFESASKDPVFIPSPMQKVNNWADPKPSGVLSQYTVNPSPTKSPSKSSARASARSESAHSGRISWMAALRQRDDSGGSAETLRGGDRGSEINRQEDEGSVVHVAQAVRSRKESGDVVMSESEETASAKSHQNGATERPTDTPGRTEEVAPASLQTAMKTPSPQKDSQQEDSTPATEPGKLLGDKTPKYHPNASPATTHRDELSHPRIVSFTETESRSPSRTTLQSSDTTNPDEKSEITSLAATALFASSPSPAGSKTVALHAQIRSLQKQVVAKTEEAKQLRRLLEARHDPDVAFLREQLRLTERECRLWRERAEAAEKKVVMFERATARVRKLRERMAAEEEAAGRGSERRGRASSVEHTEDEGVVADRIRSSLRAMDGGVSGEDGSGEDQYEAEDEGGDDTPPPQLPLHGYLKSSNSDDGGRLSATVADMWMAAEEMLEQREGI